MYGSRLPFIVDGPGHGRDAGPGRDVYPYPDNLDLDPCPFLCICPSHDRARAPSLVYSCLHVPGLPFVCSPLSGNHSTVV